MDLKATLLKEHSKQQALLLADYVGNDPQRFDSLMKLFMSKTYRVTQRAAWPMSICAERYPELLQPYMGQLIRNLDRNVHVAVKRNTVKALQHIEIPDQLLGVAANNCFTLLQSNEEPIAVKVFSMTVLSNICKKESGLAHELKLIIEDQLPYGSAGFKSRAKKVLKQLEKL